MPGTTVSVDRFVRATYYISQLSQTKNVHQAIAELLSFVQNISEPYGKPTKERPEIEPTLWRTVSDLTKKVYYFNSSTQLGFIWTSLNELKLEPGSPIMKLDLAANSEMLGDVSKCFRPVAN